MLESWCKGKVGWQRKSGLSNLHVGERLLQQAGRDVLYTDLAACNGFQAETLAPVQQPALVIIGDDDKMTPPREGWHGCSGWFD